MSQGKIKKTKKGSDYLKMRESRRAERQLWLAEPRPVAIADTHHLRATATNHASTVDKTAQGYPVVDLYKLALKLSSIEHETNKRQEEIDLLKKETEEFVASVKEKKTNEEFSEEQNSAWSTYYSSDSQK